jgi:hypothetical protein
MDKEELSPDRPGDKEATGSSSTRALEGWFLKRDHLRRALVGQAPLTAQGYNNNSDIISVELLAIDETILHKLALMTGEQQLRQFYKSLAHFFADLRRKPIPPSIRDAHKISAAKVEATGLRPKKKKSGAPRVTTSGQVRPLMEIDAIARLVDEVFIKKPTLTWNLHKSVDLDKGQLRYRRQQIQPNRRIEEIRTEFEGLSSDERVEEAQRRLASEISEFRQYGRPRKVLFYVER